MNRERPYNEKKVLGLLAQGSEFAFTELFDRYRARIYGVALKFLKCPDLAEEVVQEVFLKVWLRREDLVNILHFEGYLFTMTRNHVFDGIKEIAKETTAKSEFALHVKQVNDTDYPLIEKQYEELLQEAVVQLPPQQKQIFHLAKTDGLTHQAIADQLHISRLTVKTHMAKALHTLRRNLQHYISTFAILLLIHRIPD